MSNPSIYVNCAEFGKIVSASTGIVTPMDADREAERQRLQSLADQQLADARESAADERACGLPVGALSPDAMADHLLDIELYPDDSEIVSEIRAMFMREWGMDQEQADARMSRFAWAEAVGEVA